MSAQFEAPSGLSSWETSDSARTVTMPEFLCHASGGSMASHLAVEGANNHYSVRQRGCRPSIKGFVGSRFLTAPGRVQPNPLLERTLIALSSQSLRVDDQCSD